MGDGNDNRREVAGISYFIADGYVSLAEGRELTFRIRGRRAARCPGNHGTSERDEASKRTEDLTCSRTPVTGFGWEVAYRAGRRGADTNGAFQL